MKLDWKGLLLFIIILNWTHLTGLCQSIDLSSQRLPFHEYGIALYRLDSDTLFTGKQNIVIAELKGNAFSQYTIAVAWSDSMLKRTSIFGEDSKALVALNGSFFNVEKGGSVAYLESNGKVYSRNRDRKEKWAKTDSLLNGAIVITNSGDLRIEIAKLESVYEKSDSEKTVLISGPILLVKGEILPLENSEFSRKRHPRSCLCETTSHDILFIAIDGRSDIASGMNLREVQQFLLRLNCRDAINLDGGGSTTLWVNDGSTKEILNKPSDKEGERPVANIILIKKKLDN